MRAYIEVLIMLIVVAGAISLRLKSLQYLNNRLSERKSKIQPLFGGNDKE